MPPDALWGLRAALRHNAGRALVISAALAVTWLLTLQYGGSVETAAKPEAAFQPVPNTSPVPNGFLIKQPTAVATPSPSVATQPSSSRTEFFLFQSTALARPMHYLIYEPRGYTGQANQRYPVLYMLHGIGGGSGGPVGNETEWPGYGLLAAADRLIAKGAVQPLLIVLPQGDQSYWMDGAGGGPKYGTYVSENLVAEIDGRFRTIADRQHRAIGGLSMGGFGAFGLAMLRPDIFATAGAHSPSLPGLAKGPAFFGDQAYFAQRDPVQLMGNRPDTARSLGLWLDVAAEDPLWKRQTEALHEQLLAEGVPHQWHEWPGKHDGLYWGAHMEDYLGFYDSALAPVVDAH